MKNRLSPRRLALALGFVCAATIAQAQLPESGVSYDPPAAEEEAPARAAVPAARARHGEGEIRPYLEVAQVVSTELDGGETLTYTNVAAGVDGRISTRRVRR